MVVGCRGPRRQGRTSSSDYVTPVTAAPCGCTPDCLQPIAHRSSRDSCHFPFLHVRKRVARLPARPRRSAPRPTATPTSRPRSRWRNNRLRRRATHNHPRRFSYAGNRPATAVARAGKSSARYEGRLSATGLTLQRASTTKLFLLFPFFFFFFFPPTLLFFFPFSFFPRVSPPRTNERTYVRTTERALPRSPAANRRPRFFQSIRQFHRARSISVLEKSTVTRHFDR